MQTYLNIRGRILGVDLSPLVEKKKISLTELNGKRIAVDALNAIYQFLASIRQPDGTPLMNEKGLITSHLAGIFYRNAKLIEIGAEIIYVFDGKPPAFKKRTVDERKEARKTAKEKWKKAIEEEDFESAGKYARASTSIDRRVIETSKELLEYMGIPVIEAPSEGEAEASFLAKKGRVDFCASQDYDSLLFGCPVLIRNLSFSGRRRVGGRTVQVEPEKIVLSEVLEKNGINREQLIWVAILSKTDFNRGVPRIGPKTAVKIVKKVEPEKIVEYVKEKYDYEFEVDPKEIFSFFYDPPVLDVEIETKEMNREKIIHMLCKENGFSYERVSSTIDKIERIRKKIREQKTLGDWFY